MTFGLDGIVVELQNRNALKNKNNAAKYPMCYVTFDTANESGYLLPTPHKIGHLETLFPAVVLACTEKRNEKQDGAL